MPVPDAPRRQGGRRSPSLTLLAVCLASVLFPLSITGTSVALPSIATDLNSGLAALQWAVNGYNLTFAGFILAAGSLADLVGRKRVFLIGTALFGVGALVAAVSSDVMLLDVARAVSGAGAAAALPSGSALLAQVFEGRARARAFSLFGTTVGLGLALGPSIAGVLVSNLSWRSVFLVPAVVAFAVLLLAPFVPESRGPAGGRVDKAGTVTFTGALVLLVFGLVEGPQLGWAHVAVLGPLVGFVVLLAAFAVVERRQAQPMFDLTLLRRPRFLGLCVSVMVIVFGFSPLVVYLPSYFSAVDGLSPQQAGLTIMMLTAPTLIFPVVAGALTRWIPAGTQIVVSVLLVGVGCAWLTVIEPGGGDLPVLGPMLLIGVGVGISFGLLDGAAADSVEPERTGMASGMFNTMRLAGEATAIAVVGSLMVTFTRGGLDGKLGSYDTPYADEPDRVADLLNQGDLATAADTVRGGAGARDAFVDTAAHAYTGALHTVLWVLAALCVVAVPLIAFLMRGRSEAAARGAGVEASSPDAAVSSAAGRVEV
ncbi:MFS transporter [Streptomyces albireticuli]|uniref:MFS transporter n=1 Tax=Streptomyces albireticuli TaxID=1940 RepID=A0A2A2DGC0_9ACTN|nr:MFS transporter [Streptomyces albireticuli]MCD9143681.1 MFS transporter [Streptomyces albireticuli]MCD9161888.1 MFS transporter [Streptomyces albireticuli]MCD9191798.1 MFS transporter [Streptomyces albireticuli]PAU50449.1 MFS transporter [Streptomyces albireticuli]